MRVSFVLLAATALLASSDIVSAATDKGQTKLSQVTSYDAVEPLDAAQVNAPAKRFLRSYRDEEEEEEEDSDVDPQDEDRMMNVAVVDDIVAKTNKQAVTDLLAEAKRAESMGVSVNGLLTADMLKFARTDSDLTLFQKMYDGKVSLEKFANMMKYNPNGNLAHSFEDVYKKYKWYTLVRDNRPKHITA